MTIKNVALQRTKLRGGVKDLIPEGTPQLATKVHAAYLAGNGECRAVQRQASRPVVANRQ